MEASLTSGHAFGTLMINQNKSNYMLFGTQSYSPNKAKLIMNAYLPELVMNDISLSDIPYMKNGISTGRINGELLADKVFGSGLENCYVLLICLPMHQQEIIEITNNDRNLKSYLENYVAVPRVYGNASRRIENHEITAIREAITVLDEEIAYLTTDSSNFCKTIIKYVAQNSRTYNQLKDIIRTDISLSNNSAVMSCFSDLGSVGTWNALYGGS